MMLPQYVLLVVHTYSYATATAEIYTLSLHDALPICLQRRAVGHAPHEDPPVGPGAGEPLPVGGEARALDVAGVAAQDRALARSEEHTSELQSQSNLVCRLLLEKKKSSIDLTSRTY